MAVDVRFEFAANSMLWHFIGIVHVLVIILVLVLVLVCWSCFDGGGFHSLSRLVILSFLIIVTSSLAVLGMLGVA